MVRIAHISDTHLGCSLFQLVERREDARKCFKKAVNMALRHGPDLIIHTGDLFHSPFPSQQDVNFAVEIFKSLQKKDVKAFVLQGNHDMPYGYRYNLSPLRALETAGLIESTGDSHYRYYRDNFDGQELEIHLISWTRELAFNRLLRVISPERKMSFLFAHHNHSAERHLPTYFRYVGFGHRHSFSLDENRGVGRPGSSCLVDWKREMGKKKKLIVVDVGPEENHYTSEKINDVREFKFVTGLDITGMRPTEVNERMREWLDQLSPKKKKPIIIMQVNGMIDTETENSIERVEILTYGEKKLHPLFLHIEPNWVCVGPGEVDLTEPLNVEQSVSEYIRHTESGGREDLLPYLQQFLGG